MVISIIGSPVKLIVGAFESVGEDVGVLVEGASECKADGVEDGINVGERKSDGTWLGVAVG